MLESTIIVEKGGNRLIPARESNIKMIASKRRYIIVVAVIRAAETWLSDVDKLRARRPITTVAAVLE